MLTLKVVAPNRPESDRMPADGTCASSDLDQLGLLEFFGIELLARLTTPERIVLLQEVFVVAARAGNGLADLAAFEHIYDQMLPLRRSSPINEKLAVEVFEKNRRLEYHTMFRWVDSVYWTLPHYRARPWSTSLRGSGVNYEDPLRKLKDRVIGFAVECWDLRDDELGQAALTFLRDHYSSRHYRERRGIAEDIPLQLSDQRAVEQSLRDRLNHSRLGQLEQVLRVARKLDDKEMYRIISHAWVNAGGDPLQVP